MNLVYVVAIFLSLKKMRTIVDIVLRLKFILSPFGGSTRKKALAFGTGVGKTVVFPWRKVGQTVRFHRSKSYLRRGREDKL